MTTAQRPGLPAAEDCDFDLVSLGEVLLRLDPGESRIRDARSFEPRVGGGEFNVAYGLSNCFEMRTAAVTALADNEVGALIRSLMRRGGVDTSAIAWFDDGGTGGLARNGLNFTERGFGLRGPFSVSDRAHSAAARLAPGDIDWDALFGARGVRWLHTGGVFTALSESTARLTLQAVRAARRRGIGVSYDVNFRASLWRALGDSDQRAQTIIQIFEHVDVLISNEPEYRLSAGLPAAESGDPDMAFRRMVDDVRTRFPKVSVIAATRRRTRSASVNDWGAVAWAQEEGFIASKMYDGVELLDRVGGGDSFVAGLLYGLLTDAPLQRALELGAAHGALVMTTPGDTSSARRVEVEALAAGQGITTVR